MQQSGKNDQQKHKNRTKIRKNEMVMISLDKNKAI